VTPALDSVNTTLSGASSAGAGSVAVASATGITVGRRYLVGGREDAGGEFVTVKSLSGTTVTLVRPLRRAQASGATFQGTRVTFAITATHAATHGRNYRVEWAWDSGSVTQPTLILPFDVTRYYPTTGLAIEDVRDLDPVLAKRVPEGTWLPAVVARAWDQLCLLIAAKADPGAYAGLVDATLAHGYMTRALLAETAGNEWTEYREDMRTRAAQTLDAALAACAYDPAQSGNASTGTGWRRGITMHRTG
jgi:hypothetical protein